MAKIYDAEMQYLNVAYAKDVGLNKRRGVATFESDCITREDAGLRPLLVYSVVAPCYSVWARMLETRCRMALARTIATFDAQGGLRLAEQVFFDMVIGLYDCDAALDGDTPWPVKSDPVLLFAYQRCAELRLEQQRFNEAAVASAAVLEAAAIKKAAKHLKFKAAEDARTPNAQAMLDDLRAGKALQLNEHSLSFDGDFDALTGTNPYGSDFYAGDMGLPAVNRWRVAMLAGCIWGAHNEPVDEDVLEGEIAYGQIEKSFHDLASMAEIRFTENLDGIV